MAVVGSSHAANRNLLFGVLALKLNFVSREALVTAVGAWGRDKATSLGGILLHDGHLSPERLQLLDSLVQEHLEAHGNDVQKSLASLHSLHPLPEELKRIADPDLQATIDPVFPDRKIEELEATEDYVKGTEGDLDLRAISPQSRFAVLRVHAKGGLGVVFVARDEELNREVALKEIQESHADNPESRARFLLEAKVTGALEHPAIVPVYGLGVYRDGRPFYAMRFIKGNSLKEAADRYHRSLADRELNPSQQSIGLRKLLSQFLAACNAIEYAHSRGILHRDLKPGNIMVGKYGETLVVDWGLAKLIDKMERPTIESPVVLDENALLTQLGQSPGTPAYMSPEQAAGDVQNLGPRSDVYSLGGTLFYILTGQLPVDGSNAAEVRRNVQAGDLRRIRSIKPAVPRPLEAICQKAMALSAKDRYPSAAALAADLEAWLADEPVSAWHEPWNMRAARMLRRHLMFTTAAVAMLFGGVLGLGIYFSIRVPQLLSESLPNPHAELLPVVHAEQNLEDLLDVSRLAFFVASPEGEAAPLERARAFTRFVEIQQRLLENNPERAPLRLDLARSSRLAAMHASKHGLFEDSVRWYSKAIAVERNLLEEFPDFSSVKESLTVNQGDLAWLLATCPDPEFHDGEQAILHATEAIQRLGRNDGLYLDTLAAACARAGQFDQAVAHTKKALATFTADKAPEIKARLSLYEAKRAFHEPRKLFPSKIHR